MSRISEIFDFMRTCPQLVDLFSIAATEDIGNRVILPQGSSPVYQIQENLDVIGNYEGNIIPYPSVYEDFQINCYAPYDAMDSSSPERNINVLTYDEVQSVCEWIEEQDANGNLPRLSGEQVIQIECLPFVPQIRYVNTEENTIAYFITLRVRYVNRRQRRYVEYEN